MEIDLPVFRRLFSTLLIVLSELIQFLRGKKSICTERREILKWVSESAGREIRSLQQLWDIGPICLGKYIEHLNSQDVTWWSLQDLARATFAVPQVMTQRDMMCRTQLNAVAEKKFLRLLKRLKEALERTAGNDNSRRLRVSSDIIAKGVALSSAYTGMRGVFFVYSFRNQLEGIKIDMNGPGIAKVETRTRKDGLMVSYIASRKGMYTLEISKNNWFAPGSPFAVNVQEPPVGYKGSFGGTIWDKPDCDVFYTPPATADPNSPPSSLLWDGEQDPILKKKVACEAFPSRPKRKRNIQKSKQQVVELSQIAAAIILARRFTNRMQSRIPELRVERTNDGQELNLWSNLLTFPSPSSLREINYVSPEGATFPISVNGRRDGGHKEWMGSRGENYGEWMCPYSDTNPGNESYLQSLICPVQEDRLPKVKKSPQFTRAQNNMVRPFNHGTESVTRSGLLQKQQGRIWSQSVSIGVNTNEIWTGPKSQQISNSPTSSVGVQVGQSLLSFDIRDFSFAGPETVPDNPEKTGLHKHETIQDFLSLRAKKSDTFNSDETSSSVTTNYSEKVIEMDLKVNYETIALTSTDDDELSPSEVRETKRYLSFNDTSYDVPSIVDSNCSSFKTEEAIKPFSIDKSPPGNYKQIENERENVKPSVDGIYKATLMSLDNSISAFDKGFEGGLSDSEMTPVKTPIDQPSNLLTPLRNPGTFKNRTNRTYESIVSADGQLLTIIVADDAEPGDPGQGLCYLSANRSDLNGDTTNEISKADGKKLDLKHFKYLTKRNWTKKISSRRLTKQRSGTCKRQLRKTLSFIPKLGDKNFGDPGPNALYSIGAYPIKRDVIHIPTSVRAWKTFWDNIATRAETKLRRDIVIRRDVIPRQVKPTSETLAGRNSPLRESETLRDEDRKRRFESAKQHFTKLEKERKLPSKFYTKSNFHDESISPQKLEQRWDLKDLFSDFNKGLGKPGVVNRLGVLASLYSVEPHFTVGGFQSQYPHLPVSSSTESSPISRKTLKEASMQNDLHVQNEYSSLPIEASQRSNEDSMLLSLDAQMKSLPSRKMISFYNETLSAPWEPSEDRPKSIKTFVVDVAPAKRHIHNDFAISKTANIEFGNDTLLTPRKGLTNEINPGTLSEHQTTGVQNQARPLSLIPNDEDDVMIHVSPWQSISLQSSETHDHTDPTTHPESNNDTRRYTTTMEPEIVENV